MRKGQGDKGGVAMSKTLKPWQMTRTEWMEVRPAGTSPGMHYVYVKQALNRGRPVPKDVLADYPDLLATNRTELNNNVGEGS